MNHGSLRIRLVLPVVVTVLLHGGFARAADTDPAALEQRLVVLESKPERKSLIAEPAAMVRKTLARIQQAHAAGDVPFALELGELAKDQIALAEDVISAASLEAELAQLQTQLTEVEQKRRRTETLLEETIAQRERTIQELQRLRAERQTKKP